jgi:hypothetical protein
MKTAAIMIATRTKPPKSPPMTPERIIKLFELPGVDSKGLVWIFSDGYL